MQFCLKVIQKLFKSAFNGETIKITSNPEMLSGPTSLTRNQPKNKKTMITWVRTSSAHQDINLTDIKMLCVAIPRRHTRGIVRWLGVTPRIRPIVPASIPAWACPLIISIPPSIVILLSLWFCCLCSAPQSVSCCSSPGGIRFPEES